VGGGQAGESGADDCDTSSLQLPPGLCNQNATYNSTPRPRLAAAPS
jgi:hypothetical protein